MFNLPASAPWWAAVVVVLVGLLIIGFNRFMRHFWPQNSADRKAVLLERQREKTRRRKEAEKQRALREARRTQQRDAARQPAPPS
ncbi:MULTISPECIES: hypothetical protein [unclassified Kitasatospora]|uniref:hypothetical protein n=1 Tax=Kitasatospora sp. NPDC096077 TaxID=3155544 RepID=UPI00331F89A5